VSHRFTRLRFVLRPLADSFIFLTLTRLVVVITRRISVSPYSPPPLGDYQEASRQPGKVRAGSQREQRVEAFGKGVVGGEEAARSSRPS
jgi:hypothetical protein